MADHFARQGKSAEEVHDLLNYITRPGIDAKEVKEIYEVWADQYEKDVISSDYHPPQMLADEVVAFFVEKRDLRVLDAAAGTGRVGKAMYDRGFKNLDAIDASAKMLEEAKKLGIYKTFYQDFLGPNKLNIPDNTYDLIITTGSFVPGHLKEDCYEELIRVTKKGGHIIILMNERYFKDNPDYAHNIEPRMLELQDQGLWKRLVRKTKEHYYKDQFGVLFVLQKC